MSLVPNSVYSAPGTPLWAAAGSGGGGPNLVASTLSVSSITSTAPGSNLSIQTVGDGQIRLLAPDSVLISTPSIIAPNSLLQLSSINTCTIQMGFYTATNFASGFGSVSTFNTSTLGVVNGSVSSLRMSSIGTGANTVSLAQLISSVSGGAL